MQMVTEAEPCNLAIHLYQAVLQLGVQALQEVHKELDVRPYRPGLTAQQQVDDSFPLSKTCVMPISHATTEQT